MGSMAELPKRNRFGGSSAAASGLRPAASLFQGVGQVHRIVIQGISGSLILVLLALMTGVIGANHASGSVSDESSAFAAPDAAPTYVSELGPATVRPPTAGGQERKVADSNDERGLSVPLAPIAGVGLAIAGMALLHAGLVSRKYSPA
jgi:hypothetical protein